MGTKALPHDIDRTILPRRGRAGLPGTTWLSAMLHLTAQSRHGKFLRAEAADPAWGNGEEAGQGPGGGQRQPGVS